MNKYIKIFPAAALTLSIFGTGCTGSNNQNDINALYQRVNNNEQQIKALSSQAGQGDTMLNGQAEMWSQMQSMRQDINSLKGQLDELTAQGGGNVGNNVAVLQAKTNRLDSAMRQMSSELGMNIEALNAPDDASGGPTPTVAPGVAVAPGGSATTGPAGGVNKPTDTATSLYDSGTKAFSDKRYQDGIKLFDDFVTTYPSNALTSNAYFWQGECYYQLKDYGRAALAYNNVLEKFTGSSKYQASMLKQGMALYEAGKKDGGKVRLNELITRFPKSPEADRAKKYLQQHP